MENHKIIKISDLGQSDINENKNVIYLIDNNVNLNINSNVDVKILDISNNANIKINVSKNSNLDYLILESNNSKREFNVYGNLNIIELSLSETKEDLNVNLLDYEANFESKCLSFVSKIHSEFHVDVKHLAKNTNSNVYNIGVALNGGSLLFDVIGKINKGMNKSNCRQLSKGIVMDNDSKVDAKPVLLIDEYDCFANHGASIGKVQDDDLFYLMSRGLSKNDAFALILEGIIRPFIDSIYIEEYKNRINEKVVKLI